MIEFLKRNKNFIISLLIIAALVSLVLLCVSCIPTKEKYTTNLASGIASGNVRVYYQLKSGTTALTGPSITMIYNSSPVVKTWGSKTMTLASASAITELGSGSWYYADIPKSTTGYQVAFTDINKKWDSRNSANYAYNDSTTFNKTNVAKVGNTDTYLVPLTLTTPPPPCVPNCTGKCGGISDGCSGTCNATCTGGQSCVNGKCSSVTVYTAKIYVKTPGLTLRYSNVFPTSTSSWLDKDFDTTAVNGFYSVTVSILSTTLQCLPYNKATNTWYKNNGNDFRFTLISSTDISDNSFSIDTTTINATSSNCSKCSGSCGTTNCGLICGTCAVGQVCNNNSCCTPNCAGKCGGPDNCGGICPNNCSTGQVCNASFQCETANFKSFNVFIQGSTASADILKLRYSYNTIDSAKKLWSSPTTAPLDATFTNQLNGFYKSTQKLNFSGTTFECVPYSGATWYKTSSGANWIFNITDNSDVYINLSNSTSGTCSKCGDVCSITNCGDICSKKSDGSSATCAFGNCVDGVCKCTTTCNINSKCGDSDGCGGKCNGSCGSGYICNSGSCIKPYICDFKQCQYSGFGNCNSNVCNCNNTKWSGNNCNFLDTTNGDLPLNSNICNNITGYESKSFQTAENTTTKSVSTGFTGDTAGYQDYSHLTGYSNIIYNPIQAGTQTATVYVYAFAKMINKKSPVLTYSFDCGNTFIPDSFYTFPSTWKGNGISGNYYKNFYLTNNQDYETQIIVKADYGSDIKYLYLQPIMFGWQISNLALGYNKPKKCIIELFGWNFLDILSELNSGNFDGYFGIKLFPVFEHILFSDINWSAGLICPWFVMYQPISYNFNSRQGDRVLLQQVINTARNRGIRVFIDIVFNHTNGDGTNNKQNGTGKTQQSSIVKFDGSKYVPDSKKMSPYFGVLPYEFPAIPFFTKDFHNCFEGVKDYSNTERVICCRIDLLDLSNEQESVLYRQAACLNDLLSRGISGFRFDAGKHMNPRACANMLNLVYTYSNNSIPNDFLCWYENLDGGESWNNEYFKYINTVFNEKIKIYTGVGDNLYNTPSIGISCAESHDAQNHGEDWYSKNNNINMFYGKLDNSLSKNVSVTLLLSGIKINSVSNYRGAGNYEIPDGLGISPYTGDFQAKYTLIHRNLTVKNKIINCFQNGYRC
jgi:hypothetical protein